MQNPQVGPLSDSKYPQTHLYQHLLLCNELHDHRKTHTNRVSSNKKECNIDSTPFDDSTP